MMRLASLDVLRGVTLVGMIVVNAAAGLQTRMSTFPVLLHSRWEGFTAADAVFPAFLFMVGVSIPLSQGKFADRPLSARAGTIARRSVILISIGLALNTLGWLSDLSQPFRPFGVLQRIGFVYGACAFLFLSLSSRQRLILIPTALIAYWALLYAPCPDGLTTDLWRRGHNFASAIDRAMLGAHRYVKGAEGYDPEGLVGDIPSVAHGLIGVGVGEYLRMNKGGAASLRMAAVGLTMLGAGAILGFVLPVVKDIWSPSFVLISCGLSLVVLAALHAVLDGRRGAPKNPLVLFFMAFGMNSIFAYVLHEVASPMLGLELFTAPYRSLAPRLGGQVAELAPISIFLVLIWLPLEILRRRGLIIKV